MLDNDSNYLKYTQNLSTFLTFVSGYSSDIASESTRDVREAEGIELKYIS